MRSWQSVRRGLQMEKCRQCPSRMLWPNGWERQAQLGFSLRSPYSPRRQHMCTSLSVSVSDGVNALQNAKWACTRRGGVYVQRHKSASCSG